MGGSIASEADPAKYDKRMTIGVPDDLPSRRWRTNVVRVIFVAGLVVVTGLLGMTLWDGHEAARALPYGLEYEVESAVLEYRRVQHSPPAKPFYSVVLITTGRATNRSDDPVTLDPVLGVEDPSGGTYVTSTRAYGGSLYQATRSRINPTGNPRVSRSTIRRIRHPTHV